MRMLVVLAALVLVVEHLPARASLAAPAVPPELEARIRAVIDQRESELDAAVDDINMLNGALDIIESKVDRGIAINTQIGEWMRAKKEQAERAWLNDIFGLVLTLVTGGSVVGGAAMLARRRNPQMTAAPLPAGFKRVA